MKIQFAFMLSLLFGSTIALGEEVAAATDGLGAVLLPFLSAGAAENVVIVFAALGAVNAVSIVLEKIAEKTVTKKDDKAVAKLRQGVAVAQKVLNFFIAKR